MPILKVPKKVQPQTISGKDGLPIKNKNFCGGLHEVLQVAYGYKPICVTNKIGNSKVDSAPFIGYPNCDMTETDAKDTLAYLKTKNIYYKQHKVSSIYFTEQTKLKAYILDLLWYDQKKVEPYLKLFSDHERHHIYHILVSMLLGYAMKDTRAWFFTGKFEGNILKDREAVIEKELTKEKIKELNEYSQFYSRMYSITKNLLVLIEKKESIPDSWMKTIKKV